MKIYLIRHGETDRNLHGIINPGDVDSELNVTGLQQAKLAGENIRTQGIIFDYIISSPLQRALKTAQIIIQEIGYDGKIITHEGLKEKFAGELKDYYKKDIKKEFGVNKVDELFTKFPNREFIGLEPLKDFRKRILKVLHIITEDKKYQGKTLLIVCHGGVIEEITGKHPKNGELIQYL